MGREDGCALGSAGKKQNPCTGKRGYRQDAATWAEGILFLLLLSVNQIGIADAQNL